jgi:DNA polymerase-3 subunit alpha
LKLSAGALSETRIASLRDLLAAHPGDSPVFVHLDSGPRTTVLRLGDDFLVDARNGLFGELRVLFGAAAVL